jgi:hypothetical protein
MATRRGLREVDEVLYALRKVCTDRTVIPVCCFIDCRDWVGVRCVAAKPRAIRIDAFRCDPIFDAVNRRRVQLAQMKGVLENCWGRCIVRGCCCETLWFRSYSMTNEH